MSDGVVVLINILHIFRFSDLQRSNSLHLQFGKENMATAAGAETKEVWRKVPFISISLNAVIADIFGNMSFVHFVLLFVCSADLCP